VGVEVGAGDFLDVHGLGVGNHRRELYAVLALVRLSGSKVSGKVPKASGEVYGKGTRVATSRESGGFLKKPHHRVLEIRGYLIRY
jgi:hypothetical protein